MCVTKPNAKDSLAVQVEQVTHNNDTDSTFFALLALRVDLPPALGDVCARIARELRDAKEATLQAYGVLSQFPEVFEADHQEPLE